jgi:hypothetical protein
MSKIVRTRAQWVAEFCADYSASVKAIMRGGRRLIAAKKALEHGEFLKMIEADLPVTASVAQRLMIIAADAKLQKLRIAQHLPASWPTLYELTKVNEPTFDEAVSSGVINPKMTRKQAKDIRGKVPRRNLFVHEPRKTVIPVYVDEPWPVEGFPLESNRSRAADTSETDDEAQSPPQAPDDAPSSAFESLSMAQIERFISVLAEEIARGDLVPDKALIDRGNAASDRLKSLMTFIADDDHGRQMVN